MKIYSIDEIVKRLDTMHFRVKYVIRTQGIIPHVIAGQAILYSQESYNIIKEHINDPDVLKTPQGLPIIETVAQVQKVIPKWAKPTTSKKK